MLLLLLYSGNILGGVTWAQFSMLLAQHLLNYTPILLVLEKEH
jgi:hypothetical protein